MRDIIAIVLRNAEGKFLFGLRSPERKDYPNTWCPIGGGIEDETPKEASLREIKEELGDVKVEFILEGKPFVHETPQRTWFVHVFLYDYISGELQMNDEHSELKWMTKEEYKKSEHVPGSERDFDQIGLS